MSVLETLGAGARARVEAARARTPESELLARCAALSPARDVLGSLRRRGRPALVAEFKRSSPSAGTIAGDAQPGATAAAYARAGAAMVSVLTEPSRFGGRLEDMAEARAACALPILQKDFVVDTYQLAEARAAGADCVLLIVALVGADLDRLLVRARGLGLTALVEAHTADELDRAIASGARLIGVNNRDLGTLAVDTGTAERLLPRVPPGVFALAESGLRSQADVRRAVAAGADGVLVGEHLMRSADPAAAAAALREAGRPFVKVCGVTRRADAEIAAQAGADAIGLVFAPSPRRVDARAARAIGHGLAVARVGVFAGESIDAILRTAVEADLTAVQLHDASDRLADVGRLRTQGLDVLAAVASGDADRARRAFEAGAMPLLDARLGPRPDGHGGQLDMAAAAALSRQVRRLVLAGGLGPETVEAAVAAVDPWGVDASSGLEGDEGPGRKDAARVRAFVGAARRRWRATADGGAGTDKHTGEGQRDAAG